MRHRAQRLRGTVALLHANVAPDVALVGVYANVAALHIADAVKLLLNDGVGFTVTVTFSAALLQPFAVVMYEYVTTIGAVVVFVNVSLTPAVPVVPASVIPATVALLHANVAPDVALVGVYANVAALHIADAVKLLLNDGVGFTVTVTFSAALLQPFAVVMYEYVTTIGAVVVFVNVSLTPAVPVAAASVMPTTAALLHANVAPDVALVGVYANVAALHIADAVKLLLNDGVGFTVTVTFSAALLQPFAVVMYEYVTTIGAVVVFVNVSLTPAVPVAAASVMPTTAALLHANVAPDVALVGVYANIAALHIADAVKLLLNDGVGFTVTVTFSAALLQPFAVVMYEYVTTIGAVVVFVNVSLTPAVPVAAASVMPTTAALLHANVAPDVALVGV